MRLLVSCESPENQEKALRLAEELELTYLPYKGEDKKKYIDSYFFIYQPNSSYIRKGLGTPTKEIRCNFTHWSNSFSDPLLSKCLKGLPNKFNALDLTAGFGKDALEIAKHQNCSSVLLLEKEKWLCYLLREGINNVEDIKALGKLKKFAIKNIDNKDYLNKNTNHYDLIYIDPMFSGVGKSKAKKALQALRELTQISDTKGLLDLSIKKASKRVVVKRHKKIKYLDGIKPNYSVTGKVVRYDIYNSI